MATPILIEEHEWVDAETIFAPLAHTPFSLWLDSSDTDHATGRYSFILTAPDDILICRNQADGFMRLREFIPFDTTQKIPAGIPPFIGGAAGVFSYDFAHCFETLPPATPPFAIDDLHLPDIAIGLYRHGMSFDHKQKKCFIFAQTQQQLDMWRTRAQNPVSLDAAQAAPHTLPPQSNVSKTEYCAAIEQIIAHILDGDLFQANIAQRFSASLYEPAFTFYRRLRRKSPAPFSAFAHFGAWSLASSSPERFLFCRDKIVETRPIKGTIARKKNKQDDEQAANNLHNSIKDRAENIMIVDLMRNDLAKVCEDNSLDVTQLCAIESFAHVHHLVSTIRGKLTSGKNVLDLLAASFPGGSITGAPKLRAMQRIAQYEPHRRGPYCGACGYIGFDGTMDMNILIRSAIICDDKVYFHAGGGITAHSDPLQEYQETLDKAAGFFASLTI